MTEKPENLVLELLRGIRADMAENKAEMTADIHSLRADVRSDMHSLRADVASDILTVRQEIRDQVGSVRKDLGEQIVGLRRAVIEYHTSVIGHGIIISELEARVRRVEQYLKLPELNG